MAIGTKHSAHGSQTSQECRILYEDRTPWMTGAWRPDSWYWIFIVFFVKLYKNFIFSCNAWFQRSLHESFVVGATPSSRIALQTTKNGPDGEAPTKNRFFPLWPRSASSCATDLQRLGPAMKGHHIWGRWRVVCMLVLRGNIASEANMPHTWDKSENL